MGRKRSGREDLLVVVLMPQPSLTSMMEEYSHRGRSILRSTTRSLLLAGARMLLVGKNTGWEGTLGEHIGESTASSGWPCTRITLILSRTAFGLRLKFENRWQKINYLNI